MPWQITREDGQLLNIPHHRRGNYSLVFSDYWVSLVVDTLASIFPFSYQEHMGFTRVKLNSSIFCLWYRYDSPTSDHCESPNDLSQVLIDWFGYISQFNPKRLRWLVWLCYAVGNSYSIFVFPLFVFFQWGRKHEIKLSHLVKQSGEHHLHIDLQLWWNYTFWIT